jgi:hypothetical protein
LAGLFEVVLFLHKVNYNNIADEALAAAKKKEDVHVPAKNIGDIKSAEKVQFAPIPLTYLYAVFPQNATTVRFYFNPFLMRWKFEGS